MKKLWVVGIVVGLLLVIVVPVLAAVVWEWDYTVYNEDTGWCPWNTYIEEWEEGGEACYESNGELPALIHGNYEYETYYGNSLQEYPTGLVSGVTYWIDVETTCQSLRTRYMTSNPNSSTFLGSSYPMELAVSGTGSMLYFSSSDVEDCYLMGFTIYDEDPTPASTGMLDNFTPTGIFETASDLFNAMTTVIYIIVGITLGFTVLQMILKRLRR